MRWTWETKRQRRERNARKAVPKEDKLAFTVPDYTHGSPYVQANPVYADNPTIKHNHFPYLNTSQQQARFDRQTYPKAGYPPQEWSGYTTESYIRSERDEHVLNAREGPPEHQFYTRWVPNPYRRGPSPVDRIQRTPREYLFLRPFDKGVLGARLLNGSHASLATTGQSSAPLKGMVAPMRRRSTYRIEPLQYDATTIGQNSGSVPASSAFTSPPAAFPSRSYRL